MLIFNNFFKSLNIRKLVLLVVLIQWLGTTVFSQNVVIVCADSLPACLHNRKAGMKNKAKDSIDLQFQLQKFTDYARSKGYLTFAIDSVVKDSNTFFIYPFVGRQFQSTCLLVLSDDISLIENSPAHRFLDNGLIHLKDYLLFTSKMLSYLENNGYPFAEIGLRNSQLSEDTIATLVIDKKNFIIFDSVIVKGNVKIRNSFLLPYLGLRKKKKYNEHIIQQVPQRINGLTFVSVTRPPGVEFVDNKAYLYLFLDKQKVNQFDGYLGIVPVSEQSGKVMFTGEVNLSLQNIFHIGEKLAISWKAPERYSQYLHVSADFPYLFRTPFGVSGDFLLDKKDTNYLNMNYLVALQYSFRGDNSIKTYFDYRTSAILSSPSVDWLSPDSSNYDYHKTMYGIALNYNNLDNIQYPRSGVKLRGDFAVGVRTIEVNREMPIEMYKDIAMSMTSYRFEGEVVGYVPLHKRWVWVVGSRCGWAFVAQQLNNDLFKIGGTQTLQGFDEMSLRASAYWIGNTEIRFRFARLSYLNVFFNGGWYERRIVNADYHFDYPWGFGVGVNLDTKAGLFYISYALGQQRNSPISFKTGKIHFGLAVHF